MSDYPQQAMQMGEELGAEGSDHLSHHVEEPLLLLERDDTTEVRGHHHTSS